MKRLLIAAAVLLLSVSTLVAQLSTGSILGTARDASGAVVPGAKVTITNTGTNVSRETLTGGDGSYRVDGLTPGPYNVSITKEGFSTESLNSLELQVAQELQANATLKVGAATQTVEVEADSAPQVNVTTSTLGGLVNSQQVADLPLNGRNFIDLALLQPGVSNAKANSPTLLNATYFSTNGAPVRSNLASIDGAPMINVLGSTSNAVGTTLGVDGIQEFRVISNSPGAQYGMGMGSQIVISSKGGTNQFHGDTFDYLRNNDLDARGYFAVQEPKLIRNNFGGAFGGPIRKDKTFFYGVFEGIRQIQGVTSNSNVFSSTLGCNYAVSGASVVGTASGSNPCSTAPFTLLPNTQYNATSSPVNYNCGTVGPNCATSTGSVNPVMVPFIKLYPAPNNGATTYTANNNDPETVNYGQIRVDQLFSAKDSMFGRFTIDQSDLVAPNSFAGTVYQNVGAHSIGSDQWDTVAETHILSPNMINTGRASYSRTLNQNVPINPAFLAASPYQLVYNQNVFAGAMATTSGLASIGPTATQPQGFNQNIYTLSDDVNWTKGKHAIQFGTIFNRIEYYLYDAQYIRGSIQFSSVANFLAGNFQTVQNMAPGSNYYREPRYYTFGFYAQDDWRVSPRLTLNLGLRYEPDTAPLDRIGSRNWAFQNLTDPAPTAGPILKNVSLLNFEPRAGFAWDVNGNGKTAVRAGFGVYDDTNSMGQSFYGPSAGTPPVSAQININNQTAQAFPIITAANALPANSMPYGLAIKTTQYHVQQPRMYQWNISLQRQLTASTSVTVAYAGSVGRNLWDNEEGNPCFPSSVTSSGLPTYANPYQVAPAGVNGGNPAGQLPNPNYGQAGQPQYLSTACEAVVGAGASGAHFLTATYPTNASFPGTYIVASRLNPLWGDWVLATTNGLSNYNAGEFTFNQHVSHGLEGQLAYTFSKVQDEGQGQYSISECQGSGGVPEEGLQPERRAVDYGPSCFDVPQQLQASLIYHAPKSNYGGFVGREILSGWWVANKTTWQTGFPFSPTENAWRSYDENITSNNGYDSEYANYGTTTVAPGQTGVDGTLNSTTSTFIPYNKNTVIMNQKGHKGYVQYFNPLMFTDNALGQLGTVHKAALRGPHYGDTDLSINKDTALPHFGEKGALQFRAEVFNLFNHTNLAVPSGYHTFGGASAVTNQGEYTEAPVSTAGEITATVANSQRQVQLSLKLLF